MSIEIIHMLMTGTYTVTRSTGGQYIRGEYQPGATESIEVLGSLQPTSPRELKLPEEGNRLREYFKFYTDEPILTNDTQTLADSDKIQIDGESYRVMSVERWSGTDIPYFKAIVYREPEQ